MKALQFILIAFCVVLGVGIAEALAITLEATTAGQCILPQTSIDIIEVDAFEKAVKFAIQIFKVFIEFMVKAFCIIVKTFGFPCS